MFIVFIDFLLFFEDDNYELEIANESSFLKLLAKP